MTGFWPQVVAKPVSEVVVFRVKDLFKPGVSPGGIKVVTPKYGG